MSREAYSATTYPASSALFAFGYRFAWRFS